MLWPRRTLRIRIQIRNVTDLHESKYLSLARSKENQYPHNGFERQDIDEMWVYDLCVSVYM